MDLAEFVTQSMAGLDHPTDLFYEVFKFHQRSANVLYAHAVVVKHVLLTRDGGIRVRTVSITLELLLLHRRSFVEMKKAFKVHRGVLYRCCEYDLTEKVSR